MKMILATSVLLAAALHLSAAVMVQEGEYQFPLESVKVLGALMAAGDSEAVRDLQPPEVRASAVCLHPGLPQVFRPLCRSRDAGAALARLALVASNADSCDICEYAACTGC